MASVMHRSSSDGGSSSGWSDAAAAVAAVAEERAGWEVRPSGMVVQARDDAAGPGGGGAPPRPPPPEIKVRVKYGGARHEVSVSPIATFGQLKKLLAPRTGLQPADQQLSYRGRPRGNAEYLDACGVKNKSKMALAEDPASLERRYIERQKNARIETANRAIGAVALEVDKLADQVTSIEKSISRGNKVAEVQITTLIELLMRHAVKLESIPAAGGDSSSQKNIQDLSRALFLKKPSLERIDLRRVRGKTCRSDAATRPPEIRPHEDIRTRGEAGAEMRGDAGRAQGVQRAAAGGGGDHEMGDVRRGGHHADAVGALRLMKTVDVDQCSGYVYTCMVFCCAFSYFLSVLIWCALIRGDHGETTVG